ncbi:unnamed protein product, partial [Prorocentrum cordatum]
EEEEEEEEEEEGEEEEEQEERASAWRFRACRRGGPCHVSLSARQALGTGLTSGRVTDEDKLATVPDRRRRWISTSNCGKAIKRNARPALSTRLGVRQGGYIKEKGMEKREGERRREEEEE